ncbi:hypothetical protein ACERK3_00815 [Phycisphaerales bacterium AB-hyl4]|uniref:Uncharacterized protein n=1 Tax=Natronomicrosphaera hydrolytica TaxID=3242702 RepID=A0ABV4TZP6_9BACT
MPNHRFLTHRVARGSTLALLMLALLVSVGCGYRGQTSGRVDTGTTTEAERTDREGRILPVALVEFSDQTAQQLVQDLPAVRHIRDHDGRVTVLLGDLNNRTRVVSSNDFEAMQRRLRSNLLRSGTATEKLAFVERRGRMQDLAARERVASDGFLADPEDYDPQTTYTLNGNFYRINRGGTNHYYMDFELVHFATNEIVFNDMYEVRQVRTDR